MTIMHRFVELDDKLDELNAKPDYERRFRKIVSELIFLCSIIIISVLTHSAILNPDGVTIRINTLYFWFICFFPIIVNSLIINELMIQAMPLFGIKVTKDNLFSLKETTKQDKLPIAGQKLDEFVQRLSFIHAASSGIVRRIVGVFGLHILINIGIYFGVITIKSYHMFAMIIGNSELDLATFASILTLIVVLFSVIVSIATYSSFLESESKKTGMLIHTWNVSNCDNLVQNSIELFSMQVLHNNLNLTACGFFNLNFGLLTS
ncbi:putative gustatory receptor 28b, partial [Ctenocephalides felis]